MYRPTDPPCSDALSELQHLYQCVQIPVAAELLWDRGLTAAQREQLGGDFTTAFAGGGTIGMWAKLRQIPAERALVEVASALGFVDYFNANWLLRELSLPGTLSADVGLVPVWRKDRGRGELLLGGQVVRRVQSLKKSKNVVTILDVFEEQRWPAGMDDPLPGGRNPTRLHRTIEVLNTKLIGMKFHADGTGEGIRWELVTIV